jgi:hypothetical protein
MTASLVSPSQFYFGVLGGKGRGLYLFLSIHYSFYRKYLFVTTFYLKIPQEFVGAKPRHAVFDIDKNKFSETTINQIVDLKEQIDSNNILHTKKITRSYFRQ